MRILITGASGLVGRNIIESSPLDEEILNPSHEELNLLSYQETLIYLKEKKPEIVIHAAGIVGGIHANIANPYKFLNENIEIGKNIINASLESNVHNFLNLSSSWVYPRNASNPLSEELILTGELEPTNEGYALAKIVAMKLCQYISSQFTSYYYKTIIPCNLYGKWDKFSPEKSHLIPAIIRKIHLAKAQKDKTVEIWGDGKARREFMYAADLADFIWFSIKNFYKLPGTINVGLGYDYSILDYYEAVKRLIGYEGEFVFNLTKPVGMKQKLLDVSNCNELGWKPKYTLNKGLKETYNFFLLNEE